MFTALIFIIVLAVLIFIHELGHFLAARWCGIRVDAFKLGFGPKIFAWKRGETEYGINLIPFGGYVKIHGENPDEESTSGPDAERSFVNKSRWKQALVLVAGVGFNFIFAWLLYVVGFMSGVTATPEGFESYSDLITDRRVMVTLVAPGSPADISGFKEGDVISDVRQSSDSSVQVMSSQDISSHADEVISLSEIQDFINSSEGRLLEFTLIRNDQNIKLNLNPELGIVEDKYAVGIAMQEVGDLRLPFLTAIMEGGRYMLIMTRETIVGLSSFIGNVFMGTANFSDVAGPVGIAGIVGGAARLGFTYLLMITALISINLGVINLVPFPALDGGRLLFVIIEGIIRRRISMKFTTIVNMIGFALLMLLMVVITYKDIIRIFG